MSTIYRVVECPSCKSLFITTSNKRAKCIYCKRSFKVIDNTIYKTSKPYLAQEKLYHLWMKSEPPRWMRYR